MYGLSVITDLVISCIFGGVKQVEWRHDPTIIFLSFPLIIHQFLDIVYIVFSLFNTGNYE